MLAAADFGNYGIWSPPLISEHGGSVDLLITTLHWFMLALFIPWGIFMLYCLVRFRQGNGHKAVYEPVKGKISKYAEIGVVLFETFLLVGMSIPVWADYKNNPPKESDRMVVRVVAEQFQWNFHYPGPDGKFGRTDARLVDTTSNPVGLDENDPNAADDVWTINDFHIPTGKNIYLRLTSKDVIHSFFIPSMRVKQDVIPGMEIPIWFKVQEEATTEHLKAEMTRNYPTAGANWYKLRHLVAMKDYADKSGQVILATGANLGTSRATGTALLEQLRAAGVEEISMQPLNPLEVVCAQLCGNSHFTMKAQIVTHTPEGFDQWIQEQSKEEEFDEDF
ncbi:MAG: cytochrome c oxidase subunit II [Phycisphaerae bacterium]